LSTQLVSLPHRILQTGFVLGQRC